MKFAIEEHKEVPGKVIKLTEGNFSTVRYIINNGSGFTMVNPFGDARVAPRVLTFDEAMGLVMADVENQMGTAHSVS
jgi:hypothetical protein